MERALAIESASSGRERELALLLREHAEARERGAARWAFVHGPAGVGKSHLFGAVRRSFAARGIRVFEGRASRTSAKAYGLFAELVPELLDALAEAGIPARTTAELSRRLGPLCGRQGTSDLAPEEKRLDLCDAVAELFALAATNAPVFLLSDADAADRASLELLRYLGAATLAPGARSGGLFVLSYRAGAELPAPLSDLVARAPALSLPLAGLDLEGIRAFLSRREVAERLLEATGGLPTALEEVVASPVARPSDLFGRRLQSLGEAERDALLALAVLGQTTSADLVSRVLVRARGGAPADLASRLDRLAREHFLEIRPGVGEMAFAVSRESSRQAILAASPAEDLAALHLAAGEELSARSAEPELVARHFLAADPRGRGAVEARKAAEALADRSAFDEAAELFRRALEGTPAGEQAPLHQRLAQVLRASGDYLGALRHVGLAQKGACPELRRALRAEAAKLSLLTGRLATARKLCESVLSGIDLPAPSDAAGRSAFADVADVLFLQGHYPEARAHCERGLASLGAAPAVALALRITLAKALLVQGELPAAAAAYEANASLARQAGLPREEARALIGQGVVAHRRGDRRAAISLYRAALALCGNDRGLSALALSNLGSLYADSGEFEPAVDHLARALSAFTRARRAKEVAHCALNLARLQLFLGDCERARELSDHARATASEVGDPYLVASSHLVLGEIGEARSEWQDALAHISEARLAFESLKSPRYAAESALAQARVHLARSEPSLARGALASDLVDEVAKASRAVEAEREMVAGELALGAGELKQAMGHLSRAKEILLETPDLEGPYRVYHLLSRLRAAAGDPAGGAADAARAARLLDELVTRIPPASRTAFLKHPRRAAVLSAAGEREITPSQVAQALALDPADDVRAHGLLGKAPALKKVLKVLDAVARSNATVLIRGESGTGKEILAEALHKKSPRRDMPLVKVNCAAMVEDLLLSELFGHEKGAFTGAVRERKGRFELAEGGTIFLDEIGDISPKAQVALLRVLQEREFERVGGQKTLKIDVRVICATNRDLESMIQTGAFRQDLYYRLKGVMLELPPLRDRADDLPELIEHFLVRFSRERHEEKKTLSPEACELLRQYPWPGNVRELENVISSASIFANGRVITPEAFENVQELAPLITSARVDPDDDADADAEGRVGPRPAPAAPGEALDYFELARRRGISLKDLREEMEFQCISRALTEAKGNISEAARLLQMKRSRLSQIVNADPSLRAQVKGG
ncbi:MAG TPA: sigma 54-interacting transcriptional regulator [Myxococcales bacterium]